KERVGQPASQDDMDPNILWDIASRCGYQAHVRWSTDGADGLLEAVFIDQSDPWLLPPPPCIIDPSSPIQEFIRNPRATTTIPDRKSPIEWRASLRKVLPEYMLPNDWVILDRFPLTDNNKIDRTALPRPEHSRKDEQPSNPASSNDLEMTVKRIWSEVLNIDTIVPEDDFFELGGHSLLAVELMTK